MDLYTLFLGEQMNESVPLAVLTLCEAAGQGGCVQAGTILAAGLTVAPAETEPVEAEPVEDLEFPVSLE